MCAFHGFKPLAYLLGVAMLVAGRPAAAAMFTVGGDPECGFNSVQAAIDALPDGDNEIRIARSANYTSQEIDISGKVLILRGGYAHCADPEPSGSTLLSGQGGDNDSVLTITGSGNDVILENLGIIRGDEVADGVGGGIDFRGAGYLTLRNTAITQNYAGYGAGINFDGSSGYAELRMEANTNIAFNTAQISGGGIRAEGNARVFMLRSDSRVFSNTALGINPANNQAQGGYGGGVEVISPAHADISASITGNEARYGGGIAVMGDNTSSVSARLFTTDAQIPVQVSGNRAHVAGGGIYVRPKSQVGGIAVASFCASDFRIDGNRAPQASAIYGDYDDSILEFSVGGYVKLNTLWSLCDPEPATNWGAVRCAANVPCNTIGDNVSEDANGQATAGATVLVLERSKFFAARTALQSNSGGNLLLLSGNDSIASCVHCLLTDNEVSGPLVRAEEDASKFRLADSTLADNVIGADEVLRLDVDDAGPDFGGFELIRSILWQPGKTSLVQVAGNRIVDYVITSERFSLDDGASPHVLEADPRFEDADGGDFRPIAASPAVDYAEPSDGATADIEGKPRQIDVPIVGNLFGPRDVGAYERQGTFSLVRNRGFTNDLRLWEELTPGVTSYESVGASSAGAVKVSGTPPTGLDLVGMRQCVRIPGPGTYALNGFARTGGTGATRDGASLQWNVRPQADEACNGTVTASGILQLPRGASFNAAATPALIGIAESDWTSDTMVEIFLVAHDNGLTAPVIATAWFDGITLEPTASDVIFADGFD